MSSLTATVGGIVLCGGKSSRMGQPKYTLPFGDEVLLQRIVRIHLFFAILALFDKHG